MVAPGFHVVCGHEGKGSEDREDGGELHGLLLVEVVRVVDVCWGGSW